MAIPNGLLSNPVIAGLLGRGGPAGIKAQKDAQLAAMTRGVQGGRIPAPGAARPVAVDSLGKGLSSLGASLQGIADMRKARAKRQAIIDSRAPITTTERVMTAPQTTENVPAQFSEIQNMNRIDVFPKAVDATARAEQFLKTGNPNEQRLGAEALAALSSADREIMKPEMAAQVGPPIKRQIDSEDRNLQIQMDRDERLRDNQKAAELLSLQYTPGFQQVVAEKYKDQERTRTPTLYESADKLLAGGYVTEAANLSSIAQARTASQTAKLKAQTELLKASREGKLLPGTKDYLQAVNNTLKTYVSLEQVSNFHEIEGKFNAMEAAYKDALAGNGVSQLSMVVAMANIFDPGSVVRSEESASIVRTSGLPGSVVSALKDVLGEGVLPDKTINQLMSEARNRIAAGVKTYKPLVMRQAQIAKNYGFSLQEVGIRPQDQKYLPYKVKSIR